MFELLHPLASRAAHTSLLCVSVALPCVASAASADAAATLARATVPDEQLEPMRGGLDLGTMIARFAIERIVRIDGEVVARTQLLLGNLDGLSRGQLPDARLVGNVANLVQVGQGNHAMTVPGSSVQPPTSSGTVSTPNVANGMTNDWGTALAQAVAIANGDESNRPAPVNVGTMPAGGVGAQPSGSVGPAASTAGSTDAGISAGAAAAGAGAATAAGAGAAGSAVAGNLVPTVSISIPLGGGRVLVSGIPNGPALATSIQNSVQATRIETETRIDAAMSSLNALRSLNFAAALRQQAIDAARH